ncbi:MULTISPECIES: UDP-N-acetylmuramoyl-L-alanine--D-glutamate ligase [unclassified Sphingomonas]|uniref:UDP-N-acetylmuramoyl-L-alanine--D-glutamate ligase n=1 Tax=unclassified Sphingomonas TaxID=196159 RepID=UPI000928EAB3|nr:MULTISPECIES: UDP-N-acetylmuramoyl-L-alanine--D-glutamate ligase [unclassified Sphingomonas]MBN8849176.1 UDP-N-acetylmuramoyl-L-alanine--D-glutamate ligase [Sphingomonas sp.]OJV29398.1 MAG: UDP-N-acetylmuramoylalanine--D-glutamate ligase [Sphingomonas sp. 67-36]
MIVSSHWRGRRYAVLGLARTGAATVRALVAGGAQVVAWDSDPARREGFEGVEIAELDDVDFAGIDALVVSPGVPLNTHPLAAKARAGGVPITGDIELFAEARADLPPHKVVGITGTNGKSTTTALVTHILQTAGIPALMGGNIGLPILGQEPLPAGGVYVLELSSYQIDLTRTLDCDVAVLLNITPDHLDRYDGFDGYVASKARLFAMQSSRHEAVIGIGDAASASIARSLSARGEHLTKIAPGVCLDQSRWPSLKGPHNAQNALAAIAVVKALGVGERDIDRALETFTGLPHRMEKVRELAGVAYIDDSKATNPESTAPALGAFPRVHWIVGGRAKGDDLDACRPFFDHVVRAYTIGEAGPRFAAILKDAMPVDEAGTLAAAVAGAAREAKPGDTVLLSPAAASFDQFRDYEHRGQEFRDAVGALA